MSPDKVYDRQKIIHVIPAKDPVRKVVWRQVNYTSKEIIMEDCFVAHEIVAQFDDGECYEISEADIGQELEIGE